MKHDVANARFSVNSSILMSFISLLTD